MFVISTAMESVWGYDGVINTTGAVALVFYYLYLNTQQFKRDPMTNALNRRCFYLDAEKNMAGLSAVMSIDLNNLKQLNDGYGHAKGDEAIGMAYNECQEDFDKLCSLADKAMYEDKFQMKQNNHGN